MNPRESFLSRLGLGAAMARRAAERHGARGHPLRRAGERRAGENRDIDREDGEPQPVAGGSGRIDPGEAEDSQAERRDMIRGVQELAETTVKEVMVPRTDTLFLPVDAARAELLEKVVESGHSRIPVYGASIDDVVGILYAKDLLAAIVRGDELSLARLVRKPFFVPETKRIDSLLREMKRRRVHLAVAVDEYGGVSGIVSLEDIIEEIVGEIQDEFDDERATVSSSGADAWLCDARADLDDLNEELGLSLPADDFDSLGGYVFDLFGRIPERGESIRAEGLEFVVEDMETHRITSVTLRRLGAEESG